MEQLSCNQYLAESIREQNKAIRADSIDARDKALQLSNMQLLRFEFCEAGIELGLAKVEGGLPKR